MGVRIGASASELSTVIAYNLSIYLLFVKVLAKELSRLGYLGRLGLTFIRAILVAHQPGFPGTGKKEFLLMLGKSRHVLSPRDSQPIREEKDATGNLHNRFATDEMALFRP
ncbi:hypothetical protein FVEG_09709 [Fusarium verticillioides 7600]|uniref:Uncharacterized protein n=1 Tax=Gibberella moniliformis (strain M3125 / FGSC 7600) TaxID=334819 RepID=W7MRZ6_GIBM7|nr:hypothetical protein FVEG_09709 [Fusarium verticillioides 7600]EWG50509.1 hypothetical protein FVEG_09709 [Fusarium verticillioides 7600]